MKITSITVDTGILCFAWFEEAYQIETFDKFSTVVESIRGSVDSPNFLNKLQSHSTLGVNVIGLNLHSLIKILS